MTIFLGYGVGIPLAFLFVPIFLAGFYRIAVEEKVLSDHFGRQYAAYSGKTRRMLPRIC